MNRRVKKSYRTVYITVNPRHTALTCIFDTNTGFNLKLEETVVFFYLSNQKMSVLSYKKLKPLKNE